MSLQIINFSALSDTERDRYTEAWEALGGTMEDADCATPWCAPWFWADGMGLDLPEDYTLEDLAEAVLEAFPEARA